MTWILVPLQTKVLETDTDLSKKDLTALINIEKINVIQVSASGATIILGNTYVATTLSLDNVKTLIEKAQNPHGYTAHIHPSE